MHRYTAISTDVDGRVSPYGIRSNGGQLGIHWNLHTSIDEKGKFLFLCMKPEFTLMGHVSLAFLYHDYTVLVWKFLLQLLWLTL